MVRQPISARTEQAVHEAVEDIEQEIIAEIPTLNASNQPLRPREQSTRAVSECDSLRSYNKQTELASIVETGITTLEIDGLGTFQSHSDCSVVVRSRRYNLAIVLLRPVIQNGVFQVNFIFGSKHWRRRSSRAIESLRITFKSGEHRHRNYEFACSCWEFEDKETYVHKASVFDHVSNRMRILSFRTRRIHVVEESDTV